jgi:hypothetical protein
MLSKENPFVLLGMEHSSKNVSAILSKARKLFPFGSRVIVEAPMSTIVTARIVEAFALGGVLNPDLVELAKKFPPSTSTKRGTAWIRDLVQKNEALNQRDRQVFIDNYKNGFHEQFFCGLIKSGIELIPGDSRYAQDKETWVVNNPLREKFFVNRIKREVPKGAVGAIYGSEHVGRLKKQLEKSGIPTRPVIVETPLVSFARKTKYLFLPEELVKRTLWKTRGSKKKMTIRK